VVYEGLESSMVLNTPLKAAAICLNNKNTIVAEYEVYIVAEYEICLLKKEHPLQSSVLIYV
jgi:hypothetical protein